ncbi:hypothetical protein [Palaeococcus ferrophilus]|uniref:hypothetical protein n=1 Tax=Palaeococcus ferrophilus TaxID=83868 RepID=UPI00064E7871|nr:hypothetical protein [Palaeococcus ferrophilus]
MHLTKNESVNLKLEGIYLNGKLVWSQNISSEAVRVINPQVSLGPTNVEGSVTIVITLDNELADSYSGKPVFDSYLNKLAGRTFTITATIDGMKNPIAGTFRVKKLGYWDLLKGTLLYMSMLGIGIVFAFGPTWGHSLGAGIFSFGLVVYLAKMASEFQWILRYGGSPDFVLFVLLLPWVALTALLMIKNRSGGIIGLFLWMGLLVASKYGDNGCVMAFVFSITLWTLVETHLFSLGFYKVSRGTLFEMGTVILMLPYAVPLMYWGLGKLPGWDFWVLAISFFAFGALMKGEYLSVTGKNLYPVVYPSFLIAFAFTQSLCSIAYLLPAFRVHQISKMFLENWGEFVKDDRELQSESRRSLCSFIYPKKRHRQKRKQKL